MGDPCEVPRRTTFFPNGPERGSEGPRLMFFRACAATVSGSDLCRMFLGAVARRGVMVAGPPSAEGFDPVALRW